MEVIKPRQIINYDAGIVIIDLHQQRKNNFRQYKSATLNARATSCQRRTEPTEQQPATSAFPSRELNKLTSLLSKKGQGISQPGSLKPASETNVRKEEHIHQLKVMKNEHPAFFPHSEQDDIVNSLNYEGHCSDWVAVLLS